MDPIQCDDESIFRQCAFFSLLSVRYEECNPQKDIIPFFLTKIWNVKKKMLVCCRLFLTRDSDFLWLICDVWAHEEVLLVCSLNNGNRNLKRIINKISSNTDHRTDQPFTIAMPDYSHNENCPIYAPKSISSCQEGHACLHTKASRFLPQVFFCKNEHNKRIVCPFWKSDLNAAAQAGCLSQVA